MLSQLKEKFENIKENFNTGSNIGTILLYVFMGIMLLILFFYLGLSIFVSIRNIR